MMMKRVISMIMLSIYSAISFAGDWISVQGGAIEIDLNYSKIESELWSHLEKQSNFTFMARDLYRYQYQARTKSEIYINAFCESFNRKDLDREFLIVFDGGSCFFEALYDLSTGEFILLNVNGDA